MLPNLFCALENGEKGDIYSNHWIEELLLVARGRSSGPSGFPEASEDRYLSICVLILGHGYAPAQKEPDKA